MSIWQCTHAARRRARRSPPFCKRMAAIEADGRSRHRSYGCCGCARSAFIPFGASTGRHRRAKCRLHTGRRRARCGPPCCKRMAAIEPGYRLCHCRYGFCGCAWSAFIPFGASTGRCPPRGAQPREMPRHWLIVVDRLNADLVHCKPDICGDGKVGPVRLRPSVCQTVDHSPGGGIRCELGMYVARAAL